MRLQVFIPSVFFSPGRISTRTLCTLSNPDEYYMRHALQQAHNAFARNEVPIGAVLVNPTGIIASGHNNVESSHDVTQHAELVTLRHAMQMNCNWRLPGSTMYTTLEPCPMCLSALALARVEGVVYAAPDLRLGACGTWIDLASMKHPFHNFGRVVGGVLEEESAQLLREFFRRRRKENGTE